MTAFDPATATAAYLDSLPLAARQAAAAFTEMNHWDQAIGAALIVVAAWLVLRANLLGRLCGRIEHERPRPWVATAACAMALSAIVALVWGVWAGLSAWREMAALHQATPGLGLEILGALSLTPLWVVGAVVGVSLVYGLMRWTPKYWWAITAAVAAVFFAATVWWPAASTPGPTTMRQAPPGAARDAVLALIRSDKLPADGIYVSDNPGLDADVIGNARHARVIVSRGMWTQASPAEIRASVGHVMGHHAHRDMLSFANLMVVLTAAGLLAAHLLFRPVAWLLAGGKALAPSDPDGMPVMVVIAVGCLVLASPVLNTFIRTINVAADQYSLDHAQEPDGLAQSLVRAWHDDKVDPGPMEEALFYDHPSLKNRILHAMTWKAAHAKPPPARAGGGSGILIPKR
jgi:STE24 endopeptidase